MTGVQYFRSRLHASGHTRKRFRSALVGCVLGLLLPGLVQAQPGVRFSLINTSGATTLEALVVKTGSWFNQARVAHMAVLVEHPQGRFLFDTGLGREVDHQFSTDMPWYDKPLFAYDEVHPARDQLDVAGIRVDRIIPSHAHWDHVSALVDFPEAQVWLTAEERAFIQQAEPPAVLPTQIDSPAIQWHTLEWSDSAYRGYPRSLDLYGDGSLVLVPLQGHTPGGVGLFARVASGREFFFIGDTSWTLKGIQQRAPKFWLSRKLVDTNAEQVQKDIEHIADLQAADPQLEIVPAHDRKVTDALGYFPRWVE